MGIQTLRVAAPLLVAGTYAGGYLLQGALPTGVAADRKHPANSTFGAREYLQTAEVGAGLLLAFGVTPLLAYASTMRRMPGLRASVPLAVAAGAGLALAGALGLSKGIYKQQQ